MLSFEIRNLRFSKVDHVPWGTQLKRLSGLTDSPADLARYYSLW